MFYEKECSINEILVDCAVRILEKSGTAVSYDECCDRLSRAASFVVRGYSTNDKPIANQGRLLMKSLYESSLSDFVCEEEKQMIARVYYLFNMWFNAISANFHNASAYNECNFVVPPLSFFGTQIDLENASFDEE